MVRPRLSASRCCRASAGGIAGVGWVERQRRPNARRRVQARVGPSLRSTQPTCCSLARAALAVAACLLATPAGAHGFGQRYELPVPLSLYLFRAGAAVALSFALFGLFVRRTRVARAGRRYDLLTTPLGRAIGHPTVLLLLRAAVLGLFIVAVLAGLIGADNPYRNIAPTLVWIVWWVGLAYV